MHFLVHYLVFHYRHTFENVSFQYKDNQEKVLNRINLHVPAGAYMALVGSSGAGKTTLCSLIPRFYDVTGGCIRVDGKDVRKVTLKSLRDHIGMVQQDVYLFAGTIFENIRYGKPDATREEVIAAAKNANAHEFIMAFPDGYRTAWNQALRRAEAAAFHSPCFFEKSTGSDF